MAEEDMDGRVSGGTEKMDGRGSRGMKNMDGRKNRRMKDMNGRGSGGTKDVDDRDSEGMADVDGRVSGEMEKMDGRVSERTENMDGKGSEKTENMDDRVSEMKEDLNVTKPERPRYLNVPTADLNEGPAGWQGWLRGITYVLLWYGSIMVGFFSLYCPLLPVLLVSRPLYRRTTEVFFTMWESYAVALMEVVFGVRFFLSGDVIRPGERSILLLNHRNRLDWNYFWGALAHGSSPPAHNLKIVLKSGIRKFPGLGWIMQMACFLYIHRRWEEDQRLMTNVLNYFKDIHHTFQVLLFPEGTNLTPETQKKSEEFARKMGLPSLTHVLQPRTTGFIYLVNQLRNSGLLDAVYDVSVAYPKTLPLTELDVLQGRLPEEVHFHIRRHPVSSLPGTDAGLKTWLNTTWGEKDQLLRTTLQQGHFPGAAAAAPQPPVNASYLAFLFWTPLTIGMVYLLWTWWVAQWWCLVHTILFTIISFTTDGIQHFEVWLHRQQQRRLKRE